jgi:hypothetical protein
MIIGSCPPYLFDRETRLAANQTKVASTSIETGQQRVGWRRNFQSEEPIQGR